MNLIAEAILGLCLFVLGMAAHATLAPQNGKDRSRIEEVTVLKNGDILIIKAPDSLNEKEAEGLKDRIRRAGIKAMVFDDPGFKLAILRGEMGEALLIEKPDHNDAGNGDQSAA